MESVSFTITWEIHDVKHSQVYSFATLEEMVAFISEFKIKKE